MTDLAKTKETNLTPYNVDGLELFFTPNRKLRASQSAIARMCGHDNDVKVRRAISLLVENGHGIDVIQAKVPTAAGLRSSSLHNSSTIKILLKQFNSELLETFLDFGIDEGLAQMAGVPLPQATPTATIEDHLVIAAESALKWALLQKAVLNNPGDKRNIEAALQGENSLDGCMTLAEMSERVGIKLDKNQSRVIGSMMAGAIKCRKEQYEIPKVNRKYLDCSGRMQYTKVNNYPCSMYSSFVSACKTMGLIG
jgi:hypothetical protein